MGTDGFEYLKAPEIYSFQFVVETVTIFDGEYQNLEPSTRFELVEVPNISEDENNAAQMKFQGQESQPGKEITDDGKKKGKSKGKKKGKDKKKDKGDKKKGKGKGAKKKPPKKSLPEEKPAMVTKRKHIYLPPLRVSLKYFFNRTATVNQIDLPVDVFAEGGVEQTDPKPINNLAFDKGKKGKRKKGKGKKEKRGKRDKRGKRGKKKKGKKKKAKEPKPQVITKEPSLEWVSDDYYSPEELSWRLPAEDSFKRGLNITFPATPEQMIFWLQRGPIRTSVYRWKGYGESIPIGTANISFDSTPFIEMIVKRAKKSDLGAVSCKAEDTADIIDPQGEKIGEISAFFILICNGGTVISEYLVSEKGVFDFLGEETEQIKDICKSCGNYGTNYDYELLEDNTIAVVPNSVMFDNSPFMTRDLYKQYAEALFEILSSHSPVYKFGQYLEKVAETGISPEDIIV